MIDRCISWPGNAWQSCLIAVVLACHANSFDSGSIASSASSTAAYSAPAPVQAATYGLDIKKVVWTIRRDDGSDGTIEGVAIRGVTLHPTEPDSARPMRVLLIRDPGSGRNHGSVGELDYDVFVSKAASGRFEGVNLRRGAALVELYPKVGNDHPAVRASLDAGRSSARGDGPERHDAAVSFFPRWPMIITHAVVAGSEGTRLLVVSRPGTNGSAEALVGLIEGSSAVLDWKTNTEGPVQLRTRERICIDVQGEHRRRVAPNQAQERSMAEARRLLEAGWKTAFPDEGR